MNRRNDIQDVDRRDQGKKKSWQDSEIPDGMILIPLNLARRFENDVADASDRKMLSGFILDS